MRSKRQAKTSIHRPGILSCHSSTPLKSYWCDGTLSSSWWSTSVRHRPPRHHHYRVVNDVAIGSSSTIRNVKSVSRLSHGLVSRARFPRPDERVEGEGPSGPRSAIWHTLSIRWMDLGESRKEKTPGREQRSTA